MSAWVNDVRSRLVLSSKASFAFYRRDALHLLRRLPDDSIDSFVSDPPYGIELKLGTSRRGNRNSIAGDGRVEARRLWKAFIPEAFRAARPDTLHVVFGSWKSPWMHAVLGRHFRVVGSLRLRQGPACPPRWRGAARRLGSRACLASAAPVPEAG